MLFSTVPLNTFVNILGSYFHTLISFTNSVHTQLQVVILKTSSGHNKAGEASPEASSPGVCSGVQQTKAPAVSVDALWASVPKTVKMHCFLTQ